MPVLCQGLTPCLSDALIRLLIEKGIFTKEEFLDMVKVVNREMKGKQKSG